jgi:heterodisulfide reductase subunit B
MSETGYQYYPGCSLKGTGRHYEESFLALFEALEIPLREVDDWNCCGATAYMSIDEPTAFALAARNLARAETEEDPEPTVVAPCSACYQVLRKTKAYLETYPGLGGRVKSALAEAGLDYHGRASVRHPLDVLVNDVGIEALRERATVSLEGLRLVPYYGCLLVRPEAGFDDPHDPTTLDDLLTGLGAEVPHYPLKTRCCGGSLMGTLPEVGSRLNEILLAEARRLGAQAVVTVCPLCQFNLEAAQISGRDGAPIPVLYVTQVVGLALGLPPGRLGIRRLMIPADPVISLLREKEVSLGR